MEVGTSQVALNCQREKQRHLSDLGVHLDLVSNYLKGLTLIDGSRCPEENQACANDGNTWYSCTRTTGACCAPSEDYSTCCGDDY